MLRVDVVSAQGEIFEELIGATHEQGHRASRSRTSSDSELGMSENRQNVRPIKKTHKFLNLGALDSQVMRLPTTSRPTAFITNVQNV